MVNLQIKEHQRDVRLQYVTQSALSEYNIKTGHQILLANITSYFPRSPRDTKIP